MSDDTNNPEQARPPLNPAAEQLVPDPMVERRYNISGMTLTRWDRDESLGFPKPIWIRSRKYRRLSELLEFEERQAKDPHVTAWVPRGCVGGTDEAA